MTLIMPLQSAHKKNSELTSAKTKNMFLPSAVMKRPFLGVFIVLLFLDVVRAGHRHYLRFLKALSLQNLRNPDSGRLA